MKISCSKANLSQAINNVSRAVSTKTTHPILSCIFIEAEEGKIKLTANDTEIGIESYVDGNVLVEGKIAIEAKLLSDIIRKLPDSEVFMETEENFKTSIKCEKSHFNISGKSGEDFAVLPEVEKSSCLTISQMTLRDTINQTIFSISDSEYNNVMSGELFEVKNNMLRVVGIDGHRIAIRNVGLKSTTPDGKVIVPGRALNYVSKIINGGMDDDVNIYFTDRNILFEFDQTRLVSRLVEGEYFRIDNMLNVDNKIKLEINKREFLNSLDRSMLLIKESDKKPIKITIEGDNLNLKIDSLIGSMNEDIDIKKSGEDIIIGFNPRFIMDALRAIDNDEITIYMNNTKSPCVIKDEDETYIYLILPMGIGGR